MGVFRVTLELDKRLGQALRTQHWLRLATGMGGEGAGTPDTQRRVCGHRPGVPLLTPLPPPYLCAVGRPGGLGAWVGLALGGREQLQGWRKPDLGDLPRSYCQGVGG